jgi:hypothetical protein
MASFFWFHIASDKKSFRNSPDIHSFGRHDPPTSSIFLVHLLEYVGILEDVGDTHICTKIMLWNFAA